MKRHLASTLLCCALTGVLTLPAAAQLVNPPEAEERLEGAPAPYLASPLAPLQQAPSPPQAIPVQQVEADLPVVAPAEMPEQPVSPELALTPNPATPGATTLETAEAPLQATSTPAPLLAESTPDDAQTTQAPIHTTPRDAAQDARRLLAGAEDCRACDLAGADLSYRDFPSRDLSGAVLAAADLSLGTFDRVTFTDANMSGINGFGVRAMSANFSGANLSGATFVGSWLGGSNFAGANLADANLGGANMARTTGLTQSQLNQACGDAWTVLPRGLTVPSCLAE